MNFKLTPGKLGFRIGEVLVGLRRGTLDTPEVVQTTGGALRVASSDFAGRQAFNTTFGESVVGQRVDDVSVQFQYGNSTYDVVPEVSGSGATGNAAALASVSVGPTAGTASLTSRRAVRYRPGHEIAAQFTSLYEGAQEGVAQYHGLLDNNDGAAFGTLDGVFGAWFIKGGVEVFYPRSEWLGDPLDGTGDSGFVLDPTKLNVYMVQYGWLGATPITFSIYTGAALGWVVAHWIDRINLAELPHLNNPALPVAMRVVQTSGTGSASIETASWTAGAVTGPQNGASDRWFSYSVVEASVTAGAENNILALKLTDVFQSRENHIALELAVVSFTNDTNKTVVFRGLRNAVLAGGSAYADRDALNSTVSLSTGGTLTGGEETAALVLAKATGARVDTRGTGLVFGPGDTFSVSASITPGGSGTVSVAVRWRELF